MTIVEQIAQIISPLFALGACIVYLLVFLYIVHALVIRFTPYKSNLSKAVINTCILLFTGLLYSWMAYVGYGSSAYILPSHLFVLSLTWAEYYRIGKSGHKEG